MTEDNGKGKGNELYFKVKQHRLVDNLLATISEKVTLASDNLLVYITI